MGEEGMTQAGSAATSVTPGYLALPVDAADHCQGPTTAPVTVVVYGDYGHTTSAYTAIVVAEAQRWLGDHLRVVYRHFPLGSFQPAEATEAAATHGRFWHVHDALVTRTRPIRVAQLLTVVQRSGLDRGALRAALHAGTYTAHVLHDLHGAWLSGVQAPPAIFINGERYTAAIETEAVIEVIEAVGAAQWCRRNG
jgi:protein-disulfide isomerase